MKEQDYMPKGVCRHYKKEEHYTRDCVEFLKWLNMHRKCKCKYLITYIDESMYLDFSSCTRWINSGVTIYVVNFLQGLSMRRTLLTGERTIKVTNGEEADVEGIRELSLEITNGFTLYLNDVLYASSMRRNFTSCIMFRQ
jgi:hypothetical protein